MAFSELSEICVCLRGREGGGDKTDLLPSFFACLHSVGKNPDKLLLCQFCEDFAAQKATLMCSECEFFYCGTCFDSYHPSKGPLAGHTVGPPVLKPPKRNEENLKCVEHKKEKLALYCLVCKAAVCYMCKEYGSHKGHDVELLDPVFNKIKVLEDALIVVCSVCVHVCVCEFMRLCVCACVCM